jgi:hypothetical protein
MTLQNGVIYPEQKTYGESKLNALIFMRVSYIQATKSEWITLDTLLNWNEILNMRRN